MEWACLVNVSIRRRMAGALDRRDAQIVCGLSKSLHVFVPAVEPTRAESASGNVYDVVSDGRRGAGGEKHADPVLKRRPGPASSR